MRLLQKFKEVIKRNKPKDKDNSKLKNENCKKNRD